MDALTFSIITPSFNQAQFIPKTLLSVSSQNYCSIEHLIFDPGSTDGSLDIIKEYVSQNNFATLFNEPDRGQVDAINKGLHASRGDILTWLNSDDYYADENVLADVAKIFAKNQDVEVVYGRGKYIDTDGNLLRDAYVYSGDNDFSLSLQYSIGIIQPSLFFRRSVFEKIGGLDERYQLSLDYEYWIRMARTGIKFTFYDRYISKAVLHDASKTGGQRLKQYCEILELVKANYNYVPVQWINRFSECYIADLDGMVSSTKDYTSEEKLQIKEVTKILLTKYNTTSQALNLIQSQCKKTPYKETFEAMKNHQLLDSPKHLVVTSFDKHYYQQGLNLIASLHRTSLAAVDIIIVYDTGLTTRQRDYLNMVEKVQVVDYPPETQEFYEEYLQPKGYAYKCAAIKFACDYVREGDLVLWMDAGIVALKSIEEIFDIIKAEHIFFVDHNDKPNWPFYNIMFTHPRSLELMNATHEEMIAPHLCSCIIGYKKKGTYQQLIEEAYEFSKNREIVFWPKFLPENEQLKASTNAADRVLRQSVLAMPSLSNDISTEKLRSLFDYYNHTMDQPIYSILAARYKCKFYPAMIYNRSNNSSSERSRKNWYSGGESQDVNRSRYNLENVDDTVVIYHHRGIYNNLDGLRFKRTGEHLFVIGNGPSLRGFDFSLLNDFASIGMNAAYRYWEEINQYPTYYCCMDTVVLDTHKENIYRLIEGRAENGIKMFFLRNNILATYPDLTENPSVFILDAEKQNFDILNFEPITTGSFSVLFGILMGYRNIYLLGIDLNYVEKLDVSRHQEGTVLEIVETPAENPNYFFDNYQQKGDKYNIPNPHPGLHLRAWKALQKKIYGFPVNLVNLNPTSTLDLFPISTINEVMKQIKECQKTPIEEIEDHRNHELERLYWRKQLSSLLQLCNVYDRDAHVTIDETGIIAQTLGDLPEGSIMIDVGAHQGSSLLSFLKHKWKILAFEPDPDNRKVLEANIKQNRLVTIDSRAVSNKGGQELPFYASKESTGISSLSAFSDGHYETTTVLTTTLANIRKEYNIQSIDFLKIDAEGYDLLVLQGLDWDNVVSKPRVILCEFEDRKTQSLGYTFHDLAQFLVDKGYTVLVSEWYPIIQYGIKHDWRTLLRYPCNLSNANSWGNVIAFRNEERANIFVEKLTQSIRIQPKKQINRPKSSSSPTSSAKKTSTQVYNTIRMKFRNLWLGLIISLLLALYGLSPFPGATIAAFLATAPFFIAWRRRIVNQLVSQQNSYKKQLAALETEIDAVRKRQLKTRG